MIVVEALENINICTNDLNKSTEFYTMLFDFELMEEHEEYNIIRFDSLNVKIRKEENKVADTKIPLFSFILDVDDFTDALQELESNEIKIVNGPNETDKGESLQILDPGGNLIELYYQE